ncbi:MATE family efflux transporter [Caproiciproducens sp. CPB-2]|uniref:MATE family efflux transporter n=1 Tax=Caproiciproducens sp. CPB-2 TaxID=3030017 RepID=UPI0023DCCB71|nr:MATE family efflux transporter [Caproiciproducens sp. CPB-2]MDF1496070.1 MATE family efflux transporter [Caproiciproducens sp. CPB-2]
MQSQQNDKQFVKYVIPAVIGMVVQALYVILDGIIVGQGIGEIGLASVNIAFPCSMVVIALAMLIASGGANVYSFYKGQGEAGKANNIFNQCLTLAVSIGAVIALLGFFFRQPLAVFFGADEMLLPSTVAYLKWIAPFSLLQMLVCLLAVFVRNDDAPRLAMFASVTGAVINAILDVIFILILDFGIEAAAITNGIGMLIELTFYTAHFARKRGVLRIRAPHFDITDVKRVLGNGFATFLMEFSLPAVTFSFNLAIMRTQGTLGVTAYSIVGYVCSIINMTLIGVTQGAQPLMSFYHGSGDTAAFDRVYRLGVRTNLIVPAVLVSLCIAFSGGIVTLFRGGNPELTALTTRMLRLYPIAHIAIGPTLMNILYFQTTERNAFSTLISFLRCIGFVQIFLLLSLFVFDGKGLYLTFLAGEACHVFISLILVRRVKRTEKKGLDEDTERRITVHT